MQKITPCLWCDDQAEQAVAFYTEIFKNSRIVIIARYGDFGHEVYGKAAGTIMAIAFELDGQSFSALNGGPAFNFKRHLAPCQLRNTARSRLLLGKAVRARG